MIPDKIYVSIATPIEKKQVPTLVGLAWIKEDGSCEHEEFIRKEALLEWINAQQEKLWELLPDASNDNPTEMELRYLGQYMQLEALEDKVNEM